MIHQLILAAGLAGGLPACQEAVSPTTTVRETVDQVVMPHITLGSNVGVIVGVSRNGEQTICSYGEAELGTRTPITAESVLEIASLTKTFTALALADMHLKGEVNLDDSLGKYLPPNVKVPSWHGKTITLRQLANHTSGLPALPTNIDKEAFNHYQGYSLSKLYDFMNQHVLEYEPGTHYQYSNLGYGLLGVALSLRNGSDYESLIGQRVARPLGMRQLVVGSNPGPFPTRVPGYNGNLRIESWAGAMQPSMQGSGALMTTMPDLLRYLDANMGLTSTALGPALALTHQRTFSLAGYQQDGIGLGWSLVTLNGHQITWKNGLNGGFTAFMGFDKATQTGVVVLCNSSLNPDLLQTQMGFAILKSLNQH